MSNSSLLDSIFKESDEVANSSLLFDAASTLELSQKLAKRQRTARRRGDPGSSNIATDEPTTKEETISYRVKCVQNPLTKVLIARHDDSNHEPVEAFCEAVASTVKTYGVAVAEQVIELDTVGMLQAVSKKELAKVCGALRDRNLTWNDDRNNQESIRFREVVVRCKGRMDVLLDSTQEISFWENHSVLNGVVDTLLYGGESQELRPRLVYAGWIFSLPGSADQPFHQDGIPLFPKGSEQLPAYAINVFIPLQDTTIEIGPTEFKLYSHTMPATNSVATMEESSCPLPRRGDVLVYDYRICHRGTANTSTNATRSVLYLMYARPWFKEHVNFGSESLLKHKKQPST